MWKCRLREIREGLDLPLQAVADAIGMSAPGLWRVEQGNDPQLSTVRKLMAFYGMTAEEIWPGMATGKDVCR